MTQILTKHGEKKKLAELFGVSHVTVREALRGNSKSNLAERIRKVAIARGGIEVTQKNTQ